MNQDVTLDGNRLAWDGLGSPSPLWTASTDAESNSEVTEDATADPKVEAASVDQSVMLESSDFSGSEWAGD